GGRKRAMQTQTKRGRSLVPVAGFGRPRFSTRRLRLLGPRAGGRSRPGLRCGGLVGRGSVRLQDDEIRLPVQPLEGGRVARSVQVADVQSEGVIARPESRPGAFASAAVVARGELLPLGGAGERRGSGLAVAQ